MVLSVRLDSGDRSSPNDDTRDAVRGLHQGLARLANQVASSTGNSAYLLGELASGLDELAGRVGRASAASEEMWRMLERRLSCAEKAAQFTTAALGQVLERVEASANQRAADRVDNQLRAAQHDESLHHLEGAIAGLELCMPGVEFERRVNNIERLTGDIADSLTGREAGNMLDTSVQVMTLRIEALEKFLTSLEEDRAHRPHELKAIRNQPSIPVEPPPVLEPAPLRNSVAHDRRRENPAWELPPLFAETLSGSQDTAEPDNFLVQARRSVREVPTRRVEAARSRYFLPVIACLIAVLVAAAVYSLMQHPKEYRAETSSYGPLENTASYNVAMPTSPASDETQFAAAPQAVASNDAKNGRADRPVLRNDGVLLRAAGLQHGRAQASSSSTAATGN